MFQPKYQPLTFDCVKVRLRFLFFAIVGLIFAIVGLIMHYDELSALPDVKVH